MEYLVPIYEMEEYIEEKMLNYSDQQSIDNQKQYLKDMTFKKYLRNLGNVLLDRFLNVKNDPINAIFNPDPIAHLIHKVHKEKKYKLLESKIEKTKSLSRLDYLEEGLHYHILYLKALKKDLADVEKCVKSNQKVSMKNDWVKLALYDKGLRQADIQRQITYYESSVKRQIATKRASLKKSLKEDAMIIYNAITVEAEKCCPSLECAWAPIYEDTPTGIIIGEFYLDNLNEESIPMFLRENDRIIEETKSLLESKYNCELLFEEGKLILLV